MTHTPGPYILPCGCKIFTREYANGERGTIDFCPLHKAAPKLLEALKEIKNKSSSHIYSGLSLAMMRRGDDLKKIHEITKVTIAEAKQ